MESSYDLHVPPPISKEDFELGRMKPLSYSPEAIAAAISEFNPDCSQFCELEKLAPRQQKAVQRFRRYGTWNLGDPHNLDDIKNYFEIFNDGYFNGVLTGYCTLDLIDSKDLERRHGIVVDGHCKDFQPGRERDVRYKLEKPQIIISVRKQPGNMFIYDAIKSYHGIILHEMLRAIFDVYRCQCDQGCRQRMERENNGGHHPSWQAAGYVLEVSNRRRSNMFGLGFDPMREQSSAADMILGYTLPSEAILRPLCLDTELLFKRLKDYRAAEVKKASRDKSIYVPIKASNSCIRNEWTVDGRDRNFGFDKLNWVQGYKMTEEYRSWYHYRYSPRDQSECIRSVEFEKRFVYK